MALSRENVKLKEKAQKVFNAWIRERDKDKGCISCGGPVEHAGHYFSSGHHSAIRFDEKNVNGQCVQCNYHLHGNPIYYRINLVKRYGLEYVEELENREGIRKKKTWSNEELEEIINKYKPRRSTLRGLLNPKDGV